VTVVGQAACEGSPEASSFFMGLFKDHAIIVALDLNWSSKLLLLMDLWLLLNDNSLSGDVLGLLDEGASRVSLVALSGKALLTT